ncbi:hypothetical protein EVG20_g7512, partial [Dentipellis fragilis]
MRIYALYGGSRRVAMLIGSVSSILAAVTVWALLGQHSTTVPGVQGCHLATSNETGIHIAVAWEAQAIFDVMMMILTVYKTMQTRRELGLRLVGGNRGLVDLVFRDGAVYFAVMAGANISNILTFYLANVSPSSLLILNTLQPSPAQPILKGVLSTFAGWYAFSVPSLPPRMVQTSHVSLSISVIMMSRLMLNLYEATTPAPSMFSSTARSNIYFTTRLDAGAPPTHTSVWPYG